MQTDEVRAYCRRRGWEVAGEYVDAGISDSRERRPALDRLLVDCRKRRVDAVVAYRYDRFARSLRQLVNALEEFRALGAELGIGQGHRPTSLRWLAQKPPPHNLRNCLIRRVAITPIP